MVVQMKMKRAAGRIRMRSAAEPKMIAGVCGVKCGSANERDQPGTRKLLTIEANINWNTVNVIELIAPAGASHQTDRRRQ